MIIEKLGSFSDKSIVVVIDDFTVISLDISCCFEFVVENHKSFIFILSQCSKSHVNWETLITNFIQNSLWNNDVVKNFIIF